MKFFLFFLGWLILFIKPAEVFSQNQYTHRVYFGAKLEPRNKVLNGAGQSSAAFKNYVDGLTESTRPALYMLYVGLKNANLQSWFNNQKEQLKKYPWLVMPQIGLSMTTDGKPEEHYEDKVAAGDYDQNINEFCLAVKEWNIPCYIRIGYEFNGRWNGYNPAYFKEAFIRISNAFKKNKVKNAALLWCFATDGGADFTSYYPGDDYVDWWSIDLFAETHFTDPKTTTFLDSALIHKKPVMIGESTPRKVSVQGGEKSWIRWFQPYFKLIHEYPHIKGFCYINWDWTTTRWSDWGDGRIEANLFIKRKFTDELQSDLYLHGMKKNRLKKYINLIE